MLDTGKNTIEYTEIDRGMVAIGDIFFINNAQYICLYCDKLQTILVKKEETPNFSSVAIIPSKDSYNKIGRSTKDELKIAYKVFLSYKGILRNRSLDNVERSIKRILED